MHRVLLTGTLNKHYNTAVFHSHFFKSVQGGRCLLLENKRTMQPFNARHTATIVAFENITHDQVALKSN